MSDIKIGDTFGRWTVIKKSYKKRHAQYYTCLCSCGTVRDVYGNSLKQLTSTSCGCKTKERLQDQAKDLSGRKFGRLKVQKRINKSGPGIYFCRCECGKEIIVTGAALVSKKTKSCGCLKREKSKEMMEAIAELGYKKVKDGMIEHTQVFSLTSKLSKNNTSGVKGVSLTKNARYRAYIFFQGRQIHLGTYDTLDEAKKARERAEEEYFKPILEKYNDLIQKEK